ncbi:MAG: C69 family dipeptidase, partial [Gallicola sp.]|nr:C69 family dipeptidase [Gallicola sp.]
RKFIALALALTIVFGPVQSVLACTGLIVGKDVSADGNPIIARTEDYSSAYNKTILASPRKTNKVGELFEDAFEFKYPLAPESFKYISIPDGYQDEGDVYEAAGFNEYGVAMT